MKKIALLKSKGGHRGGLEKYASRIAGGLATQGHSVFFLTSGDPPALDPSISIQMFSTDSLFPSRRIELFEQRVKKWIDRHPVDVIFGMDRNRFQTHIRAGNGVHRAYLEARKFFEGKKKYLLSRINPMHRKILSIEKEAFENPSLQVLFVNSEKVKREVLQFYAVSPSKIQVVYNGVEFYEMEKAFSESFEKRQSLCKKLQLNPLLFHFLFIGNGYERKGLSLLLKALAPLKHLSWHLSIIGKEKNSEVFQAKTNRLGLKEKVSFFGQQPDLRPFYQIGDALLIPSFYDPFANVTLEAMAMGLFVVSSKENGGSEILTADSGVLIEDLFVPEAITAAIEKALLYPKTPLSAITLRQKALPYDFSSQLKPFIEACG